MENRAEQEYAIAACLRLVAVNLQKISQAPQEIEEADLLPGTELFEYYKGVFPRYITCGVTAIEDACRTALNIGFPVLQIGRAHV